MGVVARPRLSFTANYFTRLVELADTNCGIKTSSCVTWRASGSFHRPGKYLLQVATGGVPHGVTFAALIVSYILPKKYREAPSSSPSTTGHSSSTDCSILTFNMTVVSTNTVVNSEQCLLSHHVKQIFLMFVSGCNWFCVCLP